MVTTCTYNVETSIESGTWGFGLYPAGSGSSASKHVSDTQTFCSFTFSPGSAVSCTQFMMACAGNAADAFGAVFESGGALHRELAPCFSSIVKGRLPMRVDCADSRCAGCACDKQFCQAYHLIQQQQLTDNRLRRNPLQCPLQVRKAFTANVSKGNTLVVADYGQLELRILAHLASCESMKRAFELGGDFHSRTALGMYDHIKAAIDRGMLQSIA